MTFRGEIAVRHGFAGLALLSSWLCAAQTTPAQGSGTVRTSIRAVSYQLGTTSKIDLKSGRLAPNAAGEATIEAKQGVTRIEASVAGLAEPTKLGAEFLTYVFEAYVSEHSEAEFSHGVCPACFEQAKKEFGF